MRTILLPFHDDEASQIAAETSFQFAQRFNSFIEGLFVHRPPQIIAGEGITIPADYVTQLADDGRAHAVNARERFDRTMQAHGVPYAAVDEPADYRSFRVGLFGIDKLKDVDAAVERFDRVLRSLA